MPIKDQITVAPYIIILSQNATVGHTIRTPTASCIYFPFHCQYVKMPGYNVISLHICKPNIPIYFCPMWYRSHMHTMLTFLQNVYIMLTLPVCWSPFRSGDGGDRRGITDDEAARLATIVKVSVATFVSTTPLTVFKGELVSVPAVYAATKTRYFSGHLDFPWEARALMENSGQFHPYSLRLR